MLRSRPYGLAALVVIVCVGAPFTHAHRLTFEERVAAQEAIERVYYSHQIGATQPFEEAVPRDVLRRKVITYLKQSAALERLWNTPVTAEMLRREAERMVRGTRMPERLRELLTALGNDPITIQECLARAMLVDRLTRNFYAFDPRFHASAKAEAEALRDALNRGEIDPWHEHPRRTELDFVRGSDEEALLHDPPAGYGTVEESRQDFSLRVLLEQNATGLRQAVYRVEKTPWDDWWASASRELDPLSVGVVAQPDLTIPDELGPSNPAWNPESAGNVSTHSPCVADDTWDNGLLDDVPEPRFGHTAVWTGNLMVVW